MAKLIDILARGLRVWPEGYARLEQSMIGVVFYKVFDGVLPVGIFTISDDYRTTKVTRAEWQAAVDELNAPKVVEWDGVGRPPVGVNVNIRYKGVIQGTGIVLFYGEETCLIKNTTKYLEREQFGVINDYAFTPIRTAEQVAAEEREAEDNEVMSRYMSLSDCEKGMLGHSPERVIIGLMRLMGYRKQ